MKRGLLIISLDFELMWGVSDKRTIENYGSSILGGKNALYSLLDLMKEYEIRASFAAVGFLFFRNLENLKSHLPFQKPSYILSKFSNYFYLNDGSINENNFSQYYSGIDELKVITDYGQDLECHTFSHYYCLEEGQTTDEFSADLVAFHNSNKISKSKAIVFPRNQYSSEYLEVCKNNGIEVFRGNQNSKIHHAGNHDKQTRTRRALRLLDTFINVTGHHCFIPEVECGLINIKASRFFRAPSENLLLEKFKMKRIKNSMLYAAKNKLVFHLWWHPHNMGENPQLFMRQMRELFDYFQFLNKKYDMKSCSMMDVLNELKQ